MKNLLINLRAALLTLAWVALAPLNRYYERRWCLYDIESEELKVLEKTVKDKFEELKANIRQNQDTMKDVLDKEVKKYGETIEASSNAKLKELGEKSQQLQTEVKKALDAFTTRVVDIEQKIAGLSRSSPGTPEPSLGDFFVNSEEFKQMIASKSRSSMPVNVKRSMLMKTVQNATTLDGNQPLVGPDRQSGIIQPVNRRLTIRDLLPQLRTNSDVIQYAKELVFTNSAGPQGGLTSPTVVGGEGEIKPESNLTFQLASAPVITLAHFMGASRQVLSDAAALAGYINARLAYGLKLEEELELLTGNNLAGKLNGINNQAAAYSYTTSGTQQLDVLLQSFLQVSLTNLEASGVILHPVDWTKILMLKDTLGRYLFSDPHGAAPAFNGVAGSTVWGKFVVPTQSQALGQFTTGAFDMGAAIFDREDMNIRIADQHADFFVRNLVAILCEERLALALFRPEAFVYGAIGAF